MDDASHCCTRAHATHPFAIHPFGATRPGASASLRLPSAHAQVGAIEDQENRPRLAKLLRFYSSQSEDALTGLADYVKRMKPGQKGIYYMVRPGRGQGGGALGAAFGVRHRGAGSGEGALAGARP